MAKLKNGTRVYGQLIVDDDLNTTTVNFGPYDLTSNTFSSSSNSPFEIDSFPASDYSTVKYIVQIKTGFTLHSTELFCIQDGVTSYMTEYATLISGTPLGNFTTTISDNRMKLIFIPDNPLGNILNFKIIRYTVTS